MDAAAPPNLARPARRARATCSSPRRSCAALALMLAVAASIVVAGCGDGKKSKAAAPDFSKAPFHPSDFVDPTSAGNKWFPLEPGTQWVRDGTTLVGNREVPNKVVTTVTDVIREVEGVKTVLVYDHSVAAGQVVQESIDYLAQDKTGNIWYLGSSTEQYEAGRYIAVDEAWLHGVGGATGGILIPADPKPSTRPWSIAQTPDEGGDAAEFVKIQKKCVPYDCFDKVLVVREGKKTALDNEFKYYALGVGQVLNLPRGKSRHEDFEELINVIHLTDEGLEEADRAAMRIDGHAVDEYPEVFGDTTVSRSSA